MRERGLYGKYSDGNLKGAWLNLDEYLHKYTYEQESSCDFSKEIDADITVKVTNRHIPV